MSKLLSRVPDLPGSWRYRDVAATVLTLFGLLMLGIGAGSGYVAMPFLAFGALPFALGLAHLWHAARTTHSSANGSIGASSHGVTDATGEEDEAVALLKARYAAGELDDDELDRRLERLVELDELEVSRELNELEASDEPASKAVRRERTK